MPDNKKQHFIPRFYMKRFSPNGKDIWAYNVDSRQIIGFIPYKNQCQNRYFYGDDLSVENKLSTMENKWSIVFDRIINHKPLSANDCLCIKQFALYQRQRTIAEISHEQQSYAESLFELAKCKLSHTQQDWNPQKLKEECVALSQSTITASKCIDVCDQLLGTIKDLQVSIIHYDTKLPLLLSDAPIILINPFFNPGIGYSVIGLAIAFPISSHHLVVIYDSEIYSRYHNEQYVSSRAEEEVEKINELQLITANNLLYCSNNEAFATFSDNTWAQRNIFRNKKAIDCLGSTDQRLIMTNLRQGYITYNWSFAQIQHKYRRIPFICKDAYPRAFDEGWDKKLDMRYSILSSIFAHNDSFWAEQNITRKDFKNGCEKLSKLIRLYWKKT